MTFSRQVALFAVLSTVIRFGVVAANAQAHPLDPLSFDEYWTILQVLEREGRHDESTVFYNVTLLEPDKADVWGYTGEVGLTRSAKAVIGHDGVTAEAIVDLTGQRLSKWNVLEGVQPNWLGYEFVALADTIKQHPDFIAAMQDRGITDLQFVNCIILPPSYFGTDEQRGQRIGHGTCEYGPGVQNTWTRGIEGLTVVLDMKAGEVLRVVDEGIVPITKTDADYDRASIGKPRALPGPFTIAQPLGSGFTIDGHIIEWQKWRFHVRSDQRIGPIVSTVSYEDRGTRRPILYQGALSEIFVPYMDPSFTWAHRTYLDSGEVFAGGLTRPLQKSVDCPDHAAYLNSWIANDFGRPEQRENIICIFEREAGDMAWRHYADSNDGRKKRDLVVRSAAVLGNYDYIFDWTFQQDGSIKVAVGATGIAEVKAADDAIAGDSDDDRYGRFVDEHIVAVNHDHYFNFRLDLDVDGMTNRFVVDRLRTMELEDENPRRSVWVNEPFFPATESEARLNIDLRQPALWRVLSDSTENAVGYPTSYQLSWGKNAETLLSADDYPRRRAAFIDHHLWVTPYRPEELYAAGEYSTLSEPGMGLATWTAENRRIQDTDVVLWHTIGMHHMVRAEDWPVMPVLWHTFELRPFDFFDANPALDLPE
jgi:primary-amine oxidase